MKSKRMHARKSLKSRLSGLPAYLLIFVVVSIAFYALIDKLAGLYDDLGLLISFKQTSFGIYVAGISIGYLTIALLAILVPTLIASRRALHFRMSRTKSFAVVVFALVCGAAFAASQTSILQPYPNHISDTSGDFTLNVYYGDTSFRAGSNISLEYQLNNNHYTTTVYYLNFGGQFSMVFYNSLGQQINAFKVPISFVLSKGQTNVAFIPGQTWSTILSWNGSINNTSTLAPTGSYTLASYAVLQDANASLYVLLQTSNLSISFVN